VWGTHWCLSAGKVTSFHLLVLLLLLLLLAPLLPDLVFLQNGMLQPWLDKRGLGDATQVSERAGAAWGEAGAAWGEAGAAWSAAGWYEGCAIRAARG
jgi:hypothetical protein